MPPRHPGNPSTLYESADTSGRVIEEFSCRTPPREKKSKGEEKEKKEKNGNAVSGD